MQPAEQLTLRHLMSVITDKSKDGREYDGARSADLHYPGESRSAATVYRVEKGISRDDPSRVGQIRQCEVVGDRGDRVITNYSVLDTPDGLQIEKHSHTSNPRKEMAMSDDSLEKVLRLASEGLQRITQMQEAQAIEDELGLSFVSEQETRELLTLLGQLEAFEPRKY